LFGNWNLELGICLVFRASDLFEIQSVIFTFALPRPKRFRVCDAGGQFLILNFAFLISSISSILSVPLSLCRFLMLLAFRF
jgi:hypothetical protein